MTIRIPPRSLAFFATAGLTAVLFTAAAAAPHPQARAVRARKAGADKRFKVEKPKYELEVVLKRSKVLRSRADIRRVAVSDARVTDAILAPPHDVMILGKAVGKSTVTIWVGNKTPKPVVMLVHVIHPDDRVAVRKTEKQ
ncbi:MAG: pilus assembly protein N-terminal domain-containing protein [Pirellulales bacterium]|nr:pilus assembly protein N-terminal domain-containing protein [Pirellulales bacterium]